MTSESLPHGAARFATTRWTVVLSAKDRSSPESRQAMAALCEAYWYPLYAYVRRLGHEANDAQDLTQGFFALLLEKDYLRSVDREKGKFRSFLLAALKHFLANERDRRKAKKRGGDRRMVSIDVRAAEDRYAHEPAHALTPERLFQRRWALTLLDHVLARLRAETLQRQAIFDKLKGCLAEGRGSDYARLGRELGLSEAAVKVAVHRLRRRYRELLREEIGRTVEGANEIDGEVRELFAALGE